MELSVRLCDEDKAPDVCAKKRRLPNSTQKIGGFDDDQCRDPLFHKPTFDHQADLSWQPIAFEGWQHEPTGAAGVCAVAGDPNPSTQILAGNGVDSSEEVCFGMLSIPQVNLQEDDILNPSAKIPAVFGDASENILRSKVDGSTIGSLDLSHFTILSSLLEQQDVELQMVLSVSSTEKRDNEGPRSGFPRLTVIIYGPLNMFDEIGEYLGENELFLQDPYGCDRNVKYRNPQRLSGLDDDVRMTFGLAQPSAKHETLCSPVDLLQGFESCLDVIEVETPKALRTSLYKHQKQALGFMLSRERGWDLEGEKSDLWSVVRQPTGISLRNNVTGKYQQQAPIQFRGGILADHMGLGKTLSMISLVVSDQDRATGPNSAPGDTEGLRTTTLLIVPSSLLDNWLAELQRHLVPGEIRWVKHYGTHRLPNDANIHQYDLVLTTLQTASSEYRRHKTSRSILFSAVWDRVIVDEAHYIRNTKTLVFKGVSAIKAASRWAVTGTPIQNRLADFGSLLQFLQVYPYSSHRSFENDIVDVWKAEREEEGIERLKRLVQYITLRRSRATIELPERVDIIQHLKLAPDESSQYAEMESSVVSMLDDVIDTGHQKTLNYTNALAKIDNLRRFCNLGLSFPLPHYSLRSDLRGNDGQWDTTSAQKAFDLITSLGQTRCFLCGLENSQEDDLTLAGTPPCAKLTECLCLICATCFRSDPLSSYCEHRPACKVASVSSGISLSRTATPKPATNSEISSTKILALIAELKASTNEKGYRATANLDSVVFSSWTTTLDAVQSALESQNIRFVRVDGKVPARQRDQIFSTFQSDPTIAVLLLSLKCGAEGLNLTAASRAYMMEPQWNPTIEEQALARVHRLGQTRPVKTTRFIMSDTIEEHIIRVQDRKKHLTELLLSQSASSRDGRAGQFRYLRSLLG
ncbi:alpha-1,6-mannosyltransferase [Onygenales sp. PD_10]|nr:alpha-1,6-mannosyltransferase [Onygenales sp. PD_10]